MERNLTSSIQINKNYAEILSSFNADLQSVVDLALQKYLIDQVTAKIVGLRKKDRVFQTKYGCDYLIFCQQIFEDEKYVDHVENDIEKQWEADLAAWEFCSKGIEDWTKQLQDILMTS